MDIKVLKRLEKLNQLRLTEVEKDSFLGFFEKQTAEMAEMNAVDTENTERMVHVMPIMTVVREDKASQPFSREDLQKGAPDTDEGYWCVPRVVE